ncbi:MAG TPA: hypothetical protein VF814_14830 [Casimicrobiaceae bacterium]
MRADPYGYSEALSRCTLRQVAHPRLFSATRRARERMIHLMETL